MTTGYVVAVLGIAVAHVALVVAVECRLIAPAHPAPDPQVNAPARVPSATDGAT